MGAAMHGIAQHLLPDRRRRDRRRRARGAARVRSRRPAADRAGAHARAAATTCPAARSSRGAADFFVGAVENPGAPPFEYASAAPPRRRGAAPASCSCRSATAPSCSSGSARGVSTPASAERCAMIPSICILRSVGGDAVRRRPTCPGSTCPPSSSRASSRPPTPRPSASRSPTSWPRTRSRSRASPACTSSRSARTRASRSCARGLESHREQEREYTWTQSFGRGLGSVTIGAEQPFCVIGERINPTGRKLFAEELRGGDLSTVTVDALAQVAGGRRHARRQRRDPARRRGGAAEVDAARPSRTPSTCRSASTRR